MTTQEQTDRIERTLETLIVWIAQSSASPFGVEAARQLLDMLKPPSPAPVNLEHTIRGTGTSSDCTIRGTTP